MNNSGDFHYFLRIVPGGSVRAFNASLELAITEAYQIPDFELKDGPGWMRSERWDIDAKGSGNTPPEQVLQKLQTLLAERFHLQLHKETRELPIYALVVAKNGPKLEPSHAECFDITAGIPPPTPRARPCGGFNRMPDDMLGAQITMPKLAKMIAKIVGRTVVDKTNITGSYDITLKWRPDEVQASNAPDQLTDQASSIFTAIQEQLGLRLESQKVRSGSSCRRQRGPGDRKLTRKFRDSVQQDGLFVTLVRLFFSRFFDKESLSPQGDPAANVIQTLGILAAPGGLISLILGLNASTVAGWNLVSVRCLFISVSMAISAFIVVFEWDAVFFDRRDYQVLLPLPLPLWKLFLAKMTAFILFLGLFLAAVNGFATLFWPFIFDGGNFLAVAGTHLLVIVAASLFCCIHRCVRPGFVAYAGYRQETFSRVSICVQTALMTALVALFARALTSGRERHSRFDPPTKPRCVLDSVLLVHRSLRTTAPGDAQIRTFFHWDTSPSRHWPAFWRSLP